MFGKNVGKLRGYSHLSAIILAGAAFLASGKDAAALTAREVLDMNPVERFHYLTGTIEGLSFARWIADERDQAGMDCILGWYFQRPNEPVFNAILDWFEQHPDQQVGTLMYALIREECGEQGSRE